VYLLSFNLVFNLTQYNSHLLIDKHLALSTVNGWFDKKIGIAYGTVATGSSFGGILFPIIVSRLIREVGYGWAMRIAAFIILFLLIIANVTVKSRFPAEAQNLTKTELLRPFQELKMLAIIAGNFLFTFGVFVPITFIVVDATENGMSTELAGYLLAILNAAR
jgi:nitrate/nitrite transporter NarK